MQKMNVFIYGKGNLDFSSYVIEIQPKHTELLPVIDAFINQHYKLTTDMTHNLLIRSCSLCAGSLDNFLNEGGHSILDSSSD